MMGLLNVFSAFVSLAVWVIKEVAAKWGYRVAMVAAVMTVYAAVWVAITAAVGTLVNSIPAMGSVFGYSLMFLPGAPSVGAAAAIYYGTMTVIKAWDYFRLAAGVAAKVGS